MDIPSSNAEPIQIVRNRRVWGILIKCQWQDGPAYRYIRWFSTQADRDEAYEKQLMFMANSKTICSIEKLVRANTTHTRHEPSDSPNPEFLT